LLTSLRSPFFTKNIQNSKKKLQKLIWIQKKNWIKKFKKLKKKPYPFTFKQLWLLKNWSFFLKYLFRFKFKNDPHEFFSKQTKFLKNLHFFTFQFLFFKYFKNFLILTKTEQKLTNFSLSIFFYKSLKNAINRYKIAIQRKQLFTFLEQFVVQFINQQFFINLFFRLKFNQISLLFIKFYHFFENYLFKPLIYLTNKYMANLFLILSFFSFQNTFPYFLLLWVMLLFEQITYIKHVTTITKLKTILQLAFNFNPYQRFLEGLILKIKGKIGGVGNIRKRTFVIRLGKTDLSNFKLLFNMNTQELITETGLIKFKLVFASI